MGSASQDLILKIIAKDQYSAELKAARTAVDSMTQAEKESALASSRTTEAQAGEAQSSKSLFSSYTELRSGLDLLTMASGKLSQAYDFLVGDTMAYSKEVRELATNVSLTVEETSALIQAGDDFGIEMSTMTSTMEMMTRRGIAPSVDKLAEMADEFVNTEDPIQRANKMMEAFGRNWTALTPMLKEGGQAVRDAAQAGREMNLVTEESVKQAREQEIALDNLGDRVTVIKSKIANTLIPVLNDAADGAILLADAIEQPKNKSDEYEQAITLLSLRFGANSAAVADAAEQYRHYLWTLQEAENTTDAVDRAVARQTASIKKVIPLTQQQTDGMKAYALAAQTGGAAQENYNKWLDAEKSSAANAALSMKELTTQTIYQTASAGLSAEAALTLGVRMGLIDRDALGAAKAIQGMKDNLDAGISTNDTYATSIIAIQNAIAGLKDKNVTVTVETIEKERRLQERQQQAEETGKPIPGMAGGGTVVVPPGYPNDSYPVRVQSGERLDVTPAGSNGMSAAATTQVIINIGSISRDYTPSQAGDEIVDKMRSRGAIR